MIYKLIQIDEDGTMWVDQTEDGTPSGHSILEALQRHLPRSFIISARTEEDNANT